MKKRTFLIATAATLALVTTGFAMGQRRPGHRGPGALRFLLHHPELAEELDISSEQTQQLSNLHYEAQKKAIRLRAAQQLARLEVRHLMSQDPPQKDAVMAAIEKAGEASTALRKQHVSSLLQARAVLGPEKWKELRQKVRRHRMRAGRRPHDRSNRRHHERHRRPEPHGMGSEEPFDPDV